jgi:hypothetical protein
MVDHNGKVVLPVAGDEEDMPGQEITSKRDIPKAFVFVLMAVIYFWTE